MVEIIVYFHYQCPFLLKYAYTHAYGLLLSSQVQSLKNRSILDSINSYFSPFIELVI